MSELDEREREADRALSAALAALPDAPAPESLRRALRERWAPRPSRARAAWLVAAGVALGVAATLFVSHLPPRGDLVGDAVAGHVDVSHRARLDVVASDYHQVKPWLTAHLDFAPDVAFQGDDDFPLRGGAVTTYGGRPAAAFVFARRLHVITLFVFRAEGLAWPDAPHSALPRVNATLATRRGFHVLLWRDADLGYALVSDVSTPELVRLGENVSAR